MAAGSMALDRLGALHIHAHHDILSRGQRLADVGLGDALVLTIDAGVLQQLALGDHPLKLGGRVKVIVHAHGSRRVGERDRWP